MDAINKFCSIRVNANLHRLAKLKAYEEGMTLQEWITYLIKKELKKDEE